MWESGGSVTSHSQSGPSDTLDIPAGGENMWENCFNTAPDEFRKKKRKVVQTMEFVDVVKVVFLAG